MAFKIHIEEHTNNSFFSKLDNPKPLMKELSLMGLSAIQKNITSNVAPKNRPLTKSVKDGNKTLRDSGTLKDSLKARSTETEAIIGTHVPYARIHNPEDGRTETVITPKKAKSLAIPASPYTRTLFRQYGWSPREVIAGLKAKGIAVFRPYKKGTGGARANVILMQEKNKKPKAIFILVKSVRIPARPFMYLSDSVIAEMESRVEAYYNA